MTNTTLDDNLPTPRLLPRAARRKMAKVVLPSEVRINRRDFANGETLAARNDRLDDAGFTLHPTKGYRRTSPKRSTIAIITEQMRIGYPGDYSTASLKRVLGGVA